jgi:hypothetical protein
MTFCLPEASCLRDLDHEAINMTLENRQRWRQIHQQRWQRGQTILVNLPRFNDITDDVTDNLHTVASALLNHAEQFKLVVSINTAWVYTNDIRLLKQLSNMSCVKDQKFTKAVINRPRDVVMLKNPKHDHRSYFRSKKINLQEKHSLVQFLENHKDFVRLSPSLLEWMDNRFLRSQDYFFIDHTGNSWLTMLSLVCPNIIRKTMQIKQAK